MAVAFAPVGARITQYVDKEILLTLFAAFLVFAGAMMLFYKAQPRHQSLNRLAEVSTRISVGGVAGFLGGLLGVGGGNFILPVLNWIDGFFIIPELGEGHPQTCMMDGMQISTGATYGKVVIAKTFYGKLAAIFLYSPINPRAQNSAAVKRCVEKRAREIRC